MDYLQIFGIIITLIIGVLGSAISRWSKVGKLSFFVFFLLIAILIALIPEKENLDKSSNDYSTLSNYEVTDEKNTAEQNISTDLSENEELEIDDPIRLCDVEYLAIDRMSVVEKVHKLNNGDILSFCYQGASGTSSITYYLNNQYSRITGQVGIMYEHRDGSLNDEFHVSLVGDGKILQEYHFEEGSLPETFNISVEDVEKLEIIIRDNYITIGNVELWNNEINVNTKPSETENFKTDGPIRLSDIDYLAIDRMSVVEKVRKLNNGDVLSFYYQGASGTSSVTYYLNNQYSRITGRVGIMYEYRDGSLNDEFHVSLVGDGKILQEYHFEEGALPEIFDISVEGIEKLEIIIRDNYITIGNVELWY